MSSKSVVNYDGVYSPSPELPSLGYGPGTRGREEMAHEPKNQSHGEVPDLTMAEAGSCRLAG
jgi:hypothetical protein